ncbi:MAG: NlpC/P60 family protein [Verrucomicrobiales bacterium]|nr:NlpC/P60 family protein [Verrucomicrobiales bacterium]
MKIRTKLSIFSLIGASIFTGGSLEAQISFKKSGLYKSPEQEIVIKPDFRKGNEDAGAPAYSPYPSGQEMVPEPEEVASSAPLIAPPPIPAQIESEPEPTPEPVVTPAPRPEPVQIAKARPAPTPVREAEPVIPAPPIKKEISIPEPKKAVTKPVVAEKRHETPARIGAPRVNSAPAQIGRYPSPQPPAVAAIPAPAPMVHQPSQNQPYPPSQPAPAVSARQVFPSAPSEMVHTPDRALVPGNGRIPPIAKLREEANVVARQKIEFRFGRAHPAFGGLDSSGAVQYLLNEVGIPGVPRTTAALNGWIRANNNLHEFRNRPTVTELENQLIPGNLIFWGDHSSGRVTHVMIYLGYDSNRRQHLAFGTRGGTELGINGSEVDIFSLKLDREKIIATGSIPGFDF